METIKNYLETMFASLPNTPEVLKAKAELWQMMEDKYNELIAMGKTDNEAVATVIGDFGNLNELAADLGIETVQKTVTKETRRQVSWDECRDYINDKGLFAYRLALGILLCIVSVTPWIFNSLLPIKTVSVPMILFFGLLAFGVLLIVFSGTVMSKWNFLKRESCFIDYSTAKHIEEERDIYRHTFAAKLTIGILLCALCWLPIVALDDANVYIISSNGANLIGTVIIFLMAGMGVFFIVQASAIMGGFDFLTRVNQAGTIGSTYKKEVKEELEKEGSQNILADLFIHNYWSTIAAIYLVLSFLTHQWGSTWLIFPIASLLQKPITRYFKRK